MTPSAPTAQPAPPSDKRILGHPPGLFILFFTEMWERFSYYGMRALLVLYMTDYLLIKPEVGAHVMGYDTIKGGLEWLFGPLAVQPFASQIYGLYTGFVYFTPFFGGLLADRVFGQRKTVVLGAILMAIGHFLMASERLFFPALLFLILGNGCFKPNIATQVGGLYPPGDPRRDRAFTIFYMGVNLGAFFSPLICGTLGQKVGWHWGFAAAGVGMVAGLIIYLWGQRYLAADHLTLMKREHIKEAPLTREDWKKIGALVVLCALNIVFWGVYEQQGNTMQLWADRRTDWLILGWELPSTWFQAFNPAMIFIFAPLLNILWAWQNRRGKEPSSIAKMALGCAILGISFFVMVAAANVIPAGQRGSVGWLLGATFIYTIGELYLSPIGLSLVTKVAPARMVSMLMGMWYLSSFFGNYLSGFVGTFYEKMPKSFFFALCSALALTAGLAIFLMKRPLSRAMHREV